MILGAKKKKKNFKDQGTLEKKLQIPNFDPPLQIFHKYSQFVTMFEFVN